MKVSKIIKTLKIPDGIINFEAIIKNNTAYIIEINPRPSGNYIWKLMGYKYSIDVPTFIINLYFNTCNQINYLDESNNYSYAYQLIYTDENKKFTGFKTPSLLKNNILDINIFNKTNDPVNSFKNLHDRIGVVLLEFKSETQKNNYINNIKKFNI